MDYRQLADVAMQAGTLMLRAGAEIYRVEDTMQRILNTSGAETTEVLVLSTAIVLTIDDPSGPTISKMQRISVRGTNLGMICDVNELSRRYCAGEMDLNEMKEGLERLCNQVPYPTWLRYLCTLVTVIAFTLLLGGDAKDALISGGAAVVLAVVQIGFSGRGLGWFIRYMVALAGATFFVSLVQVIFHVECNQEVIVAGTAMPLLPGVAITNAIRDTLHGDYISGAARVMEAFVKAVSCAVGIGIGLYLGSLLTGGVL